MSLNRGDIYFVNLNPVIGREQAGRRPVLILSDDSINRLPLVVTVVIGTDGANVPRDYPTNVRVSPAESGLPIETVFLCFQIRSIDASRFPAIPAGRINQTAMSKIALAVRKCLAL
jgi:mRNA interferase MazF